MTTTEEQKPITPIADGETKQIPLSEIRPNLVALRPAQIESQQFQELKANIQQLGEILQPVRIRPRVDEQTGENYFELVDGLQRFTVAEQLGFETIPARLRDSTDERALVEQIALNAVNVATKPAEFARQLLRLLDYKPATTKAELAQLTGMSEAWVDQRLALNKLLPQIGTDFVDAGAISVSNGYQLARLPQTEQLNYLEQAETLNTEEFTAAVNQRLKEIRQALRAGKDPKAAKNEFQPVATIRRAGDIKTVDPAEIIPDGTEDTAVAGAKAAIEWVLQLDPDSVAQQKERFELRRRERLEAQVEKQKERAEEMAAKASERAAQLRAEMGV